MITRGIVEAIIVNELPDYIDTSTPFISKKYRVRLPLFNGDKSSPGATPYEELPIASAISLTGIYDLINVGDAVFVDFEENDYSKPVIIGLVRSYSNYTWYSGVSLKVGNSATLPYNTKIGDISYSQLQGLVRWWRNSQSGSSSGGAGDVDYIEIYAPTGVFSSEALAALMDNNLSQIIYNSCFYTLGYKDGDIRRYITNVESHGSMQMIDVNTSAGTWAYRTVLNEALQAHINDTNVHIQSGERDYWNDKITCTIDSVNTEKLIFTKNNLLTT